MASSDIYHTKYENSEDAPISGISALIGKLLDKPNYKKNKG
jgi:hypothetical protein